MHKKLIIIILCALSLSCFAKDKILIQGAMDIEISLLIKSLKDAKEERVGAWTYWVGTIGDKHVIVSRTEIGLINAAAATAIAIQTYQPTIIINQGTAGAHDPALHKGDLVLGEKLINIGAMETSSGKSTFFDVAQRLRDKNNQPQNNQAFYSDKKLLKLAKTTPYTKGKKIVGIIGSADQWNRDAERINLLHKTFKTSAEEMEAVAAAQVASAFHIPFLSIRILSNAELHQEYFNPETAQWCQEFTLNLIGET